MRLLLLLVLTLFSAPVALADTVTFEGFSDGTSITSQFSNISFSNATIATAGVSLNEFEFPPHSGSNVVFDDGGAITISFASPVAGGGGYFTYTTQLTLTAYDTADNVIGTLSSAFNNNLALSGEPGSQPSEFLTFSMLSGISRITILGDPGGGSFTLDDLTFNTSVQAVPEPSSIILLLTGSGVLCRFRRRIFSMDTVASPGPKT